MSNQMPLPLALRLYRVMSFVVGVMLLIFCFFIVMRHGFGKYAGIEMVVAQIHGLFYMIYLATVLNVWLKLKPSFGRIFGMICAGFIPLLAFFVEHSTIKVLAAQAASNEAQ